MRYLGNVKVYGGHGDLEVYYCNRISGLGIKVQVLAHLH